MVQSFKVETFQCQLKAESFPPSLGHLNKMIANSLPEESELLQWAIVKSHKESKTLWIEGSLSTHK